ncbi:MAG: hypothetical protein ABJZ55_08940 [Fuerstiella sp.]
MTVADQISALTDQPENADRTVLVLGASNVSLAWSQIVSLVLSSSTGRADFVTAHGMGRAYASASSGFVFRRLPGILHSGLWAALPKFNDEQAASVLITDLGNDLLYGCSVSEVVEAAGECVSRVRQWNSNADFVVTAPPLTSVLKLQPTQFRIMKQLLFPSCPLKLPQVQQATQDLFDGIQTLAADQGLKIYEPPARCFGYDPIHIRRRDRRDVFHSMLKLWEHTPASPVASPPASPVAWKRFSSPVPESRTIMGRSRTKRQPAIESDRLRVFAY